MISGGQDGGEALHRSDPPYYGRMTMMRGRDREAVSGRPLDTGRDAPFRTAGREGIGQRCRRLEGWGISGEAMV